MSRIFDRFRRDDGRLSLPGAIAEGITASPTTVWSWVVLPTRSTDDLNTSDLVRETARDASTLRRVLPPGSDFHIKVIWGRHDGSDYVNAEIGRLAAESPDGQVTDGQQKYIDLGGQRIDDNTFLRRIVLLGVRIDVDPGNAVPAQLRRSTRHVAGESARVSDAEAALRRAVKLAENFHARMLNSSFHARPATVAELAWALRHDLRRTVSWVPEGTVASPGQVARLLNDSVVHTQVDHVEVATDGKPALLRIVQAAETGFPATDLSLPGGEWLKDLTLTDPNNPGPAFPVELSIRGRMLAPKDAAKRLREALALAREQRREASHGVAETAPQEIGESEDILTQRLSEVVKGDVGMVADNVSWIVEATNRDQLDERTQVLVDHYGGMGGIDLWTPTHVQDVLWKETVLGDRLRFRDCEQLRPVTTLVGSWFHGGSIVGDDEGPVLGGVIGSTPSPFRSRLTNAQLEQQPVTSVFVGRSRVGKSTGVMLSIAAEVILGAWGMLADYKGDLGGIVPFCRAYGVSVTEVNSTELASGSMCSFRYIDDVAEAASVATDNLTMMLSGNAGDRAASLIRQAANVVAARPKPGKRSTYAVVQELLVSPEPEAAAIGRDLDELRRDPLARPVAGPPVEGAPGLPTGPGLVYMRFENLRMPGRDTPQASWKPGGRLSAMLVQASATYATYMASRVRGIPKVVALTEMHLITPYDFGRTLVSQLARTGAALDVNLLLDSQAAADLLLIEGLLDQVSAVHAFGVATDAEADAQAILLGLEPEQRIRDRQRSWSRGQCEVRDRHGNLGPVQFDYMSAEIATWLDTTPKRDRTANLGKVTADAMTADVVLAGQ